jgi:TonB-dependent SusC/RagA subfamily outer membrane receptor
MKTTTAILILMIGFQYILFSQTEKEIPSKIARVTVYSKGAQIESEARFELQQGKTTLLFKNLSPYIDEKSIRVDGDGKFTILNVQVHNDYLNELEKNKEVAALNTSIQQYQDKIEDEETWINIINEKQDFIKSNKNISGSDKSVNPEDFKSLNSIYGDNIEKNAIEVLKRQRLIKEYKKELEKLTNQLAALNSKSELPSGVITVMVNSKQAQSANIKLSYMVSGASWYPSYDIRFSSINKPLSITYKANISQNTGIDWKDVELKLSTAKTNISGQIPELSANYLQFYQPNILNGLRGESAGVMITSQDGAPDSNSPIHIRGIATITGGANPLYVVDGVEVGTSANFLNPNDVESVEILKDASATAIYGAKGANGVVLITTKKQSKKSKAPLTTTSKNETSVEFSIEGKQSVNSDNKLNTLVFKESEINATYEFQSIPKLSKNVYLIAKISDWQKADLSKGETNLYFENSFIGNSEINSQEFTDTLDISFGVDNNIIVERQKIKDFSETRFIGSNKKVTSAWKLSVRNNKGYPVKVKLYDQVPISSTNEIQVEMLELSGGNLNKETGKVEWNIVVKENETKQYILKYSVKYAKDKTVIIE